MSKYDPLRDFLKKQSDPEVRMSFEQIERVIGEKLPPSAERHRAWWSNNAENNVMTIAWLGAGFESADVQMERRKVVFRRVSRVPATADAGTREPRTASERHPLLGWMKGTMTAAEGVDLTRPAEAEWGGVTQTDGNWNNSK